MAPCLEQQSSSAFKMPQLISMSNQVNGPHSFRPPLDCLSEDEFKGFCFTRLSEFFEESQINF